MRVVSVLVVGLFVAMSAWGLYGFGGETLTEWVARRLGLTFRTAASLIALAVTLTGMAGLSLWVFSRRRKS